MIELQEFELQENTGHSSKGNQLKWKKENIWHKADYAGYEGLAEATASWLLTHSSLSEHAFVTYQTEQIHYKSNTFLGACSQDFLKPGQQLITLERLFSQHYGKSLYQNIFHIEDHKNRLRFLVDSAIQLTGLSDFGIYMNQMLTLDALILNEDRHTHNIAVIMNPDGSFDYCPIFDNGASLLSDTTLDYPLEQDTYALIPTVKAKTFCLDFEEQLDLSEELYGYHLSFQTDPEEMARHLHNETLYPQEIITRVEDILRYQIRKYQYLFK